MKRLALFTLALVACDGSVTEPAAKPSQPEVASLVACIPTAFSRDGHVLTAAVLGTAVPITRTVVDATGCDIGIYYAPGITGSVDQSTIAGATYFGVVNHSAAVNVTRSSISNIGDRPFGGSQHGIGIIYTTENEGVVPSGVASGTISGNSLSLYQKGGITIRGVNASADILDNRVTGFGPVDFIAQNGIQVSFGGSGGVRDNIVSGHDYTPASFTSCGVLLFQAAGVKVQENQYFENETNMCNFGKGSGNPSE